MTVLVETSTEPSEPLSTHLTIPDHVQQANHVRSPREVLQDLDLALDLLLLDRLEHLDDAFAVRGDVDGFEDLGCERCCSASMGGMGVGPGRLRQDAGRRCRGPFPATSTERELYDGGGEPRLKEPESWHPSEDVQGGLMEVCEEERDV